MENLSDSQERLINYTSMFFGANFTRKKIGAWFLDGQTLINFIINRKVSLNNPLEIGLCEVNEKQLIDASKKMDTKIKKLDGKYEITVFKTSEYQAPKVHVKLYNKLPQVEGEDVIRCPDNKIDLFREKDSEMSQWGTWNYNINPLYKYAFPVPYRVGAFLDITRPGWFKDLNHDPRPNGPEIFFNPTRTKNAVNLMKMLHECAKTAGFRDYIFPGFGTLLGIIREGDFIQSDRDMDHCIMGSKITKEQEERFLIEVAKKRKFKDNEYPNGLFTGRKREPQRRKDNSRFLWFSCGHKKPSGKQTGCKSCVWKFFDHAGYSWHSKGGMWVKPEKFSELRESIALESDAVGKGISSEYLQEFTTMTFQNIEINVPVLAGHCLDAWYSSWARPRKGCSEKKDVLLIPDWNNKKSWKML